MAIIGGQNWGSIGVFGFDAVAYAFGGAGSAVSRVVYTLVGLAAIWWHLAAVPVRDRCTSVPKSKNFVFRFNEKRTAALRSRAKCALRK